MFVVGGSGGVAGGWGGGTSRGLRRRLAMPRAFFRSFRRRAVGSVHVNLLCQGDLLEGHDIGEILDGGVR